VNINDAFADVQLLYIDTAPFIYYTESRAGYVEKMRAIFEWSREKQAAALTSTITLTECLSKPLRENDTALISAYNTMLRSTRRIALISVDAAIATRAADLRAQYTLRTPDALHIATALSSGCDTFLTNDLRLKRIQEVRVLVLDELELDPSGQDGE
jgi:predicted nucleic acid-binding protein